MNNGFQSSPSIALVRAEYVIPFVETFRQMGAPVDRELRRARLPTLIEELPNEYVSMDLTFRFVKNCVRLEGIDDIGFEAGWDLSFGDFSPDLKTALQAAPSLKTGIEIFTRLITLEDTGFRCALLSDGDTARICSRQYVPPGGDSRIAEWQNLKAIIEIVRLFAGPDWLPAVIGLESSSRISPAIRQRLGNITILTGRQTSFVQLPRRLLALPIGRKNSLSRHHATSVVSSNPPNLSCPGGDELVNLLSAALGPYLASGYPPVDLAAEIAGTSVRSLQRRLSRMQTSYTGLVEGLRFQRAFHLLRNSDLKILDIALSLGYQDASNFSRAIRRISGFSPIELRRQLRATADSRVVA